MVSVRSQILVTEKERETEGCGWLMYRSVGDGGTWVQGFLEARLAIGGGLAKGTEI